VSEGLNRCLGLDVGDRRIGVALGDPLGLIASPMPAIKRASWKVDLARVRELIREFDVRRVVVGLPIRMDGKPGERVERTMEFVERLRASTKVPVETWDERLSTREAERRLLEANMRREKRREVIDGVAASLILQTYLDCQRTGRGPREGKDLQE